LNALSPSSYSRIDALLQKFDMLWVGHMARPSW
jgi:hypothetical protein